MNIEIDDSEIRSSVMTAVRCAVNNIAKGYRLEAFIREKLDEQWQSVVAAMIDEQLKDSKAIKQAIAAQLEKKLRHQLSKALAVKEEA